MNRQEKAIQFLQLSQIAKGRTYSLSSHKLPREHHTSCSYHESQRECYIVQAVINCQEKAVQFFICHELSREGDTIQAVITNHQVKVVQLKQSWIARRKPYNFFMNPKKVVLNSELSKDNRLWALIMNHQKRAIKLDRNDWQTNEPCTALLLLTFKW